MTDPFTEHSRKRQVAMLALVPVGLLLFAGLFYACGAGPRKATHALVDAVRATGKPPYALVSTNAADADATLAVVAKSSGLTILIDSERGVATWTRACVTGWLGSAEGGRFLKVALEQTRDGWLVRDVSFRRSCQNQKNGDMRLR